MWKNALLALLLFSGSLHAEGRPGSEPGFDMVKQGENPIYLSTIGVTEVPGKPDVIVYPMITNITADIPDMRSAKGSSIVVTIEMNCRTGRGKMYGMKVYSEHFGRGTLKDDFSRLQGEQDASLPDLHKQPPLTPYLLAAAMACTTVGKPLGGTPDVMRDIINRGLAASRSRH